MTGICVYVPCGLVTAITQARSGQAGDGRASFNLGMCYSGGVLEGAREGSAHSLATDLRRAEDMLQRAAQQGNERAPSALRQLRLAKRVHE